jgi:hypothetical protein
MADDAELRPFTVYERRRVRGTRISWDQPAKILPVDPEVCETVLAIERDYERRLAQLQQRVAHLPSRTRSLLWILSSLEPMAARGFAVADAEQVRAAAMARLPLRQPPRLVASA